MSEITQQQYINLKKKLYKDVKKHTEVAFKKSEVKNKASALNLALPQYARYFVLAKLLDVKDPMSLEFDQLKKNIRDKVLMGGMLTRIYVAVTLTIIDEVQYYLLKSLISKSIPNQLGLQVIKFIVMFGQKLGMNINEDLVMEAFYLSNITNVKNLKVYDYNKDTFNQIDLQEKLKHVNQVIAHGLAMAYSYEASSIVASFIGAGNALTHVRNIVMIVKYIEYIKKSQKLMKVNEIQGSKFLNIITTKLKDVVMNFLGIIRIEKLRYILRFVLETILGPLALTFVIRGANSFANAANKTGSSFL